MELDPSVEEACNSSRSRRRRSNEEDLVRLENRDTKVNSRDQRDLARISYLGRWAAAIFQIKIASLYANPFSVI